MDDYGYLLRNKHRLAIMKALHQRKQHYAELVDITGLKPGSIYHHLKVLDKLLVKEEQGVYAISDRGTQIIETLNLVEETDHKPQVSSTVDSVQHSIFLGRLNPILSVFILTITILLAYNGLAFAGSAIYVVPRSAIVIFDLIAFLMGWGLLYLIEYVTRTEVYNSKWFTLTIRLVSMLPGSIVGLALFSLYQVGIHPSNEIFPVIFALTTVMGLLVATLGEIYLRSQPRDRAILFASIPITVDLLLGLVILYS